MVQTIDKIKIEHSPKARLERFLSTHKVKVSHSFEEMLGPETEQTQEEIRAEVDDFAQLRDEWRKETRERDLD